MTNIYDIYPFNLARVILEDEVQSVYLQGIRFAISTLTEREEDVIKLRFKEGLTLRETGQRQNVTQERVRQIEAKAIRKLRHPTRKRLMLATPLSEVQEIQERYNLLAREHDLLVKAFELLQGKSTPEGIEKIARAATWMQTDIESLGFSVRTYNCLKRARKDTLRDIVEMTPAQLQNVRNLGRKSFEEVVDTLKQFGLSLKGANDETSPQ